MEKDEVEIMAPSSFKKKILKMMAKNCPGNNLRINMLRSCGYKIGKDVYIGEDFIVSDLLTTNSLLLEIGDRASISPRVTVVVASSPNNSKLTKFIEKKVAKVTIGNDAWIGAGAIILPGVTIGEGAIIGAGSVVNKNMPPWTVCYGVPCKPMKKINDGG